MKTNVIFDPDGWISIEMEAETAKEAGQLVQFGINAGKDARKVTQVYAQQEGVKAYVSLATRRDRSFQNRSNRVSYVRPQD